jgi:hypothetical protein
MRGITGRNIFNKKETKKEVNKRELAQEKKTNILDVKTSGVENINFSSNENVKPNNKPKVNISNEPDIDFSDLSITEVKSNKNGLPQRFLMKQNIIPKHPGVSLFVGSIGSGKTTLLNNLLAKPQYYGVSKELSKDGKPAPYFDYTFLLTGSDDDMYNDLIDQGIIQEQHIKFSPTPEDIQQIIDVQSATIKEKGLLKSPKILIILEDIVDNTKLMGSSSFRSLFIKPRQHNFSVWMMAQYMNLIPKSARQQAINLFIFLQNRAGNEIIVDQYCPAHMKKKEFLSLIQQATEPRTGDTHPFLHINRRVKLADRYRRNLQNIIQIMPNDEDDTNDYDSRSIVTPKKRPKN